MYENDYDGSSIHRTKFICYSTEILIYQKKDIHRKQISNLRNQQMYV